MISTSSSSSITPSSGDTSDFGSSAGSPSAREPLAKCDFIPHRHWNRTSRPTVILETSGLQPFIRVEDLCARHQLDRRRRHVAAGHPRLALIFPHAHLAVARQALGCRPLRPRNRHRPGYPLHGTRREIATRLRAEHFDAAILLQNAFDAALVAWLATHPRPHRL